MLLHLRRSRQGAVRLLHVLLTPDEQEPRAVHPSILSLGWADDTSAPMFDKEPWNF